MAAVEPASLLLPSPAPSASSEPVNPARAAVDWDLGRVSTSQESPRHETVLREFEFRKFETL